MQFPICIPKKPIAAFEVMQPDFVLFYAPKSLQNYWFGQMRSITCLKLPSSRLLYTYITDILSKNIKIKPITHWTTATHAIKLKTKPPAAGAGGLGGWPPSYAEGAGVAYRTKRHILFPNRQQKIMKCQERNVKGCWKISINF